MKSTDIKELKKQKPIKIFSTGSWGSGVNVVKSPVKLMILSMLKESEMEFDEIVRNIGKSKSTVSVHLKALRNDGVISFKINPEDQRKKIFYINSRFLGEIKPPEPVELEEQKTNYLIENLVDTGENLDFSKLGFHTLRSTLIQEGINIDPLLYATGVKIGYSIYDTLKADDFDEFIANLTNFWKENSLGDLSFSVNGEKITVKKDECFECTLLPKTGKPACLVNSGMLNALFTSYLKKEVDVVEVNCNCMGDESCIFEIEPLT
ncbi:V4R domain-containing protein [Methanobrevibacter filiformis]|uniref:V4R domain protein n=1 Tax=Methanobrevibacter filiformis TaxID=55758 RepID=A0A166AGA8_9EURY|nr:V4R domain-containing protein [Methanobrevibacter filiformis]KZX11996.1 V4R domain protein [Methanobrevibacter filiformis]